MKDIMIRREIGPALSEIARIKEPVRVTFDADSCNGGAVVELIAISNALESHYYETTAKITGAVSVIGVVGANKIEMDNASVIYVAPLKIALFGGEEAQESAVTKLKAISGVVSGMLAKWPLIRAAFDNDEEIFIDINSCGQYGLNVA